MNIDQANAWKAALAAEEKQRAERVAAWQEEEQRQREQAYQIVNHRFRHPDIAYSFRPVSYWEIPVSPLELALRNVKGTRRREMIRDFYEQGRLDQLVPVLAADELSDEDREGLGAIHPSFMGGVLANVNGCATVGCCHWPKVTGHSITAIQNRTGTSPACCPRRSRGDCR